MALKRKSAHTIYCRGKWKSNNGTKCEQTSKTMRVKCVCVCVYLYPPRFYRRYKYKVKKFYALPFLMISVCRICFVFHFHFCFYFYFYCSVFLFFFLRSFLKNVKIFTSSWIILIREWLKCQRNSFALMNGMV